MKSPSSSKFIFQLFLPVCLLTAMIYAPIIYRMTKYGYDYVAHMGLAVKMLELGEVIVSHFLFHMAVITVALFSPEAVPFATIIVLLSAILVTGVMIAMTLNKVCSTPAISLFMTIALLIAAPIAILAPLDEHLYFGYISANVFHNPTILLLKPLALLSFGLIVNAFEKKNETNFFVWIVLILATIACVLTKPSFTICILPATALLLIVQMRLKHPVDVKLLLFCLMIPAVITLFFQFYRTYSEEQIPGLYEGKSGIIFAPLIVAEKYSSWLLPKLLLSLIFPLAVLLSDFRGVVKDTSMQLSWLAFLIGAAYFYLMAESGPRMFQGNFSWSGQITLFILFVSSAKYLLHERYMPGGNKRAITNNKFYFCIAALSLHSLFGIIFYIAELIHTGRYW